MALQTHEQIRTAPSLAEKSGIAPDRARYVVETMIDLMKKQQFMEGGRIEIRGFGSFEMREYDDYEGRTL